MIKVKTIITFLLIFFLSLVPLISMEQLRIQLAGTHVINAAVPQGINIPYLFSLMNYQKVYELTEYSIAEYKASREGRTWEKTESAAACIECGACESKCPQHLEIVKQLKETHSALEPV